MIIRATLVETVRLLMSAGIPAISMMLFLALLTPAVLTAARGDLNSSTRINNPYSPADDIFSKALIDTSYADNGVTGIPAALYDIVVYKIVYDSIDAFGALTQASALVEIPMSAGTVSIVCYHHGTETHNDEVPSRTYVDMNPALDDSGYLSILSVFSAGGYLTVAPDYVGMGDSPGFHPYHHVESQGAAAVDAIRAARTLTASLSGTTGTTANTELYLSGYSQGGHATLSTHSEIEAKHAAEFTIKCSAPGAGAYDLSGAQLNRTFTEPDINTPMYLAYIIYSMNEVYTLQPDLSGIFKPPYDTTIPGLFDGTNDGITIRAGLPGMLNLDQLFYNANAADLRANHPDFMAKLLENSLHNWVPIAPILFLYADADTDVYQENSFNALEYMLKNNAPVRIQRVGTHKIHGTSYINSLEMMRNYFDSFSGVSPTTYNLWRGSSDNFFSEQIILGDPVTGMTVDHNNDNVFNLTSYALGLDPTLMSVRYLPTVSVDTAGKLEMTIIHRTNDLSLNVEMEISNTLLSGSWSTAVSDIEAGTPLNMGGGFQQLTYTSKTVLGTVGKQFLRIKVTR